VRDNRVVGNDSGGIAVIALPFPNPDPRVDPFPDGNRVVGNVALANGRSPDLLRTPFPGADLIYDGSGSGTASPRTSSPPRSRRPWSCCSVVDSEQEGVDRLRRLWDFTDLDATERRLRAALREETNDSGRAEVLTQLARIEGLHSRFDEANRLLGEAEALAGASDVARVRVLLERGRVLRLSGNLDAALPLFEEAFETALAAGQDFIAGDAAHMAALAGDMIAWTARGLELARRSPAAAHWVGTLLNNLGWWHAQRGEQAESLAAYRGSLEAWERHATYPYLREAARLGVARALRALGRAQEALPLLEQAVAWTQAGGHPNRAFHEELAAAYADLGLAEEAAEQERLSMLAGPGQFALWQSRPRPPRTDPGS
jgi:tetratricopeptide (TPR) repeat protein